ncbi:carboxypeptidase-like regulatory domain-containing protein [Kordia sp.]|uniref:carboxypeptidase-like regulatory domain-containing protein n=1 Tax=Kordia sp. TaxID=1965332 RepID=UPI003D6A3C51
MKHPELIVQIPEPCHEDWNNMSSTEKGKFCGVCTKEIIDFSAKSDEEIVKHVVANNNLCGRFHPTQLDRKLIVDRKKRNHWVSYAASLLLPLTLFSQEVKKETQNISKTEQTNNKDFKSLNIGSLQRQGKVAHTIQNDSITINGVVTDDKGLPLSSTYLVIKGTHIGVTTDPNGNYTFKVNVNDTIKVTHAFHKTISIKITKEKRTYNIVLEPEITMTMVLGGAVAGVVVNCPTDDYYKKSMMMLLGDTVNGLVMNYSSDDYYKKPMSEAEITEKKERTKNYFAFQKKKWQEKRAKRRAERAARKAERQAKNN